MYIQLTTRCNMECAHCCFSCTAEGEDMTEETFEECIANSDGHITLGGGEPTIHPQFESFLLTALCSDNIDSVLVITNGKKKKTALRLAALAKCHTKLNAQLSQDDYHERISYEVMDAFRDRLWQTTQYKEPLPHGRAWQFFDEDDCIQRDEEECPCTTMVVAPDGTIRQCGCDNAPEIGHIFGEIDSPCLGECCNSSEFTMSYMDAEREELLI